MDFIIFVLCVAGAIWGIVAACRRSSSKTPRQGNRIKLTKAKPEQVAQDAAAKKFELGKIASLKSINAATILELEQEREKLKQEREKLEQDRQRVAELRQVFESPAALEQESYVLERVCQTLEKERKALSKERQTLALERSQLAELRQELEQQKSQLESVTASAAKKSRTGNSKTTQKNTGVRVFETIRFYYTNAKHETKCRHVQVTYACSRYFDSIDLDINENRTFVYNRIDGDVIIESTGEVIQPNKLYHYLNNN